MIVDYRLFALTISAFILSGCGNQKLLFQVPFQAYEGAALPSEQLATVFYVGSGPGITYRDVNGFISSVDQKSTMDFTKPAPLEVHLIPGIHNVGMRVSNGIGPYAYPVVSLDAKAGHTYELKVKFTYIGDKKYSIQSWAEDKGVAYLRTDAMYWEAKRLSVGEN